MSSVLVGAAARPKALGVPLVIVVALLGATPAFAAPKWGIMMTHANAYGLQASECPTGKEESFPGEPERDCGVDPFTGSGETFSQESGFNTYTITVKNLAAAENETLVCSPGEWENSPTSFSYQWLRNGVLIGGATDSRYTTTGADAGTAVQCVVAATNEGGTTETAPPAIVVAPAPTTSPPGTSYDEAAAFVEVAEGGEPEVGSTVDCTPNDEAWSGNPTFSYEWVRNGELVEGATTDEYTLTASDAGAAVQCVLIGSNAGGATLGESSGRLVVSPQPGITPPVREIGTAHVAAESSDATQGAVSIADSLPEGLTLAGAAGSEAFGPGWQCDAEDPSAVTCTRSDPLAPGAAYPPITLHVHVDAAAPLGAPPSGGVTNIATVSGGAAEPATATATAGTRIASVPFGIDSFATSVTDESGGALTQSGAHPFSANAKFVFNFVPDDFGELRTAGGSPKDIETALPAGFIGNPQTRPACPASTFAANNQTPCPIDTAVGFVKFSYAQGRIADGRAQPFAAGAAFVPVYHLTPDRGDAASFGFIGGLTYAHFTLAASVRSDGDYGITVSSPYTATPTPLGISLTFCENGVTQEAVESFLCAPATTTAAPFLTNPTRCEGPAPVTTLRADTYEAPGDYTESTSYAGTPSAPASFAGQAPSQAIPNGGTSFVTGCDLLQFAPTVDFGPSLDAEGDTTQADEPTGASFSLRVPQTDEAAVNATPELKGATVTLPEGMTVDPSAADGLQACSNSQFGLGSTAEPTEPAACPSASQIGKVKLVTPLLEKPLEGQVFLGGPECSPCSNTDAEDGRIFRLLLQIRSVERGVIVKLAGHVTANPVTGRLQATFAEQPQLPFSELLLTFNGGARASLANPQTCGTSTTTTDLTPWSTSGLGGLSGTESIAGTPDATPSSSFDVDWNGAGGACPPTMPFSPSLSAGSQSSTAGESSPFSIAIGREDREQDVSGISVSTPPGLLGKIAGIPRCPEAQANAGTCGAESEIGTTIVGAGPGPHPFYLGGRVYLTGPYQGEPFGLSIVTAAVAGPFNLGTVVVRAAIAVNPSTAALTIVADPLPQYLDGVQLRLRKIDVEVNRAGFMLNPTSCAHHSIAARITAAQGASANVSTPFGLGGCAGLPFKPTLTASAGGRGSKAGGSSLDVKIQSPGLGQTNIAKVDLQIPKALSTRDSTLNKACAEAVFAANPAACPEGSIIGKAAIKTPVLAAPLVGPAYLVSHGSAAFPDVEIVLQGEGVTLILDGKTNIRKGITYSSFESTPDAPFTTFETELPTGPHSIFTADVPVSAKYSLCSKTLAMPTRIVGQNGAVIERLTKVAVTGCKASKPLTRGQKLAKALAQCRKKKNKEKRASCEAVARKEDGPLKKVRKSARTSNGRVGR